MPELAPRTPTARRAYKDDHLALQFARLQGATDNVRQIFGEGRFGGRDMSLYTHAAFDPLERVYTDAAASGLTFHDWIRQQRGQGRRPILEVERALGGPQQAAQYQPAAELIENMRDLVRMGAGKQRGLYRKGGGQRLVNEGLLGRQIPVGRRNAPKRAQRERPEPKQGQRGLGDRAAKRERVRSLQPRDRKKR